MSTLTDNALVIQAPADITVRGQEINQYKSAWHVLNGACLRSIQLRKPALVAEGTKQELSHELEVVLVHREGTGSRFANVIVPIEVSAEPSLDLLAPLLDQAELPSEVGELQPVLVSMLPLKLANVFANVSFQHFWAEVKTSCNGGSAGARIFMRNQTIATSKSRLQRVLNMLQYAPEQLPTLPPTQTWLVQPCPRGGSCAFPTPTNLTPQLLEAQAALANDSTKLQTAKQAGTDTLHTSPSACPQAMDESLLALTGNGTEIANDVYTTAVRSRDHLRNAQAAVDGASRTVETLQAQIDSAASAVWDSDAPPVGSGDSRTTTSTSTTTAISPAVSAKPSMLATGISVHDCSMQAASPVEVDLAKTEHVDAGSGESSEALLFWRLSATPGLPPAEAAAAESAAVAPELHVANLGDRLRITPVDQKPLMVLLVHGLELPISFVEVSVPGQHALAGKRSAAEIQLVHMPSDASKAVAVAMQMDTSQDENAWFQHLGDSLPRAGMTKEVQGADPMMMHPAFGRGVAGHFFRYDGRLLQDSSCARIRWHVLEERGHLSSSQLQALRQVLRPPGSAFETDPSALSPTLGCRTILVAFSFGPFPLVSCVLAAAFLSPHFSLSLSLFFFAPVFRVCLLFFQSIHCFFSNVF
ncbi:unnamed protein product [Durusdinium trenchii]|uniref:Alpha-carbonic anhydrase domain-containing protein n=1 Tax=Durusdinium trenchii TaxID=1381693 RepID=A0ABP0LA58_9DINO